MAQYVSHCGVTGPSGLQLILKFSDSAFNSEIADASSYFLM